jgi:hypothetical protein
MSSPTKSKRTAKFYRGTRSRSQRISQQGVKKAEELVKNLNEDKYPTISQRSAKIELLKKSAKKIGYEVLEQTVDRKLQYYIKEIPKTGLGIWQGMAAQNLRKSHKRLSALREES